MIAMKKSLLPIAISLIALQIPIAPAHASTNINCSISGTFTVVGAEVTGSSLDCGGAIEIPSAVETIRFDAFRDRTAITAVTFQAGSSLTTIGSFAFENTGISSIEIPANVTSIEEGAFGLTANLRTLTFAAGSRLQSFGDKAFSQSSLTVVRIPASVTSIGGQVFEYNADLASVIFEPGSALTSIGFQSFVQTGITEIELPANLITLGNNIFERADFLDTVTFATGSRLTAIGYGMFHYSGLRSISLPSTITSIGASAFYNNPNLSSITIPAGVTSIGANAFGSSITLSTIRFESTTAPTVGSGAFSNVSAGAVASIRHNATGFDPMAGLWNSLTVVRDAAPAPEPSSAVLVVPPAAAPAAPVSTSFSLDSPVLASQQKKALRELIAEVGKGGNFEVVARVVRTPGMSKAGAKALALAKAREIKKYLVSRGVKKKDILVSTKLVRPGKQAKTRVLGSPALVP